MLDNYKNFLELKGTNSFWKKAKQREYTGLKAVEKITNDLTNGFNELTTRNSIGLRYLGFILNKQSDNLEVTNIGKYFLNSDNKQDIIDKQILKIYLNYPELNRNLELNIFPAKVLLLILKEFKYFTEEEYKLFICWSGNDEDINNIIKLIREYRISNNKLDYNQILNEKVETLGIKDFNDNIIRFFNMLILSSYFDLNKDLKQVETNLSKDDIDYILDEYRIIPTDTQYVNYFVNDNEIKDLKSNSKEMEKLTSQELLLLTSLLTKPFSILYGVSGTGKSRVVQELWKKIYDEQTFCDYFHKVAVPPNWFDESEVLGRYNEIEKYKEGSFITILEKAIKDKDNKYVYLLDEMNLSHIEQYFAQYLSAIEDLSSNSAWIHVGETQAINIKEKISVNENNIDEEIIEIDISRWLDSPYIKLSGKDSGYSFYSGEIEIDGQKFHGKSNSFQGFYRQLFKYFINKYQDNAGEKFGFSNFDEDIMSSKISISEESLRKKSEEDSKNIESQDGIILYNTEGKINYFYYKGYYYWGNQFGLNSTINHIAELLKKENSILLNSLSLKFKKKDGNSLNTIEVFQQEIIEYENDNGEVIGKSLKIPSNFFVVGTINLDETTKSISPKVVDRANLIEFNDIDNYTFLKDNGSYDLGFLDGKKLNIDFNKLLELRLTYDKWSVNSSPWELKEGNQELMQRLYDYLKVFKLHFSYRTINEILTFVAIGKAILGDECEDKLLDLAFMQKVLPKLNGVIDPSFRLSDDKGEKYLYYISDDIEDSIMNTYPSEIKEILKSGVLSVDNEKLDNTFIKLKRMQQFFNTYQNVNYFLS